MASCGDIAPAEVRNGGDAGNLGDAVRVADLERKRMSPARVVINGLAVAADGFHFSVIDAASHQQPIDAGCKNVSQFGIKFAEACKPYRFGEAGLS